MVHTRRENGSEFNKMHAGANSLWFERLKLTSLQMIRAEKSEGTILSWAACEHKLAHGQMQVAPTPMQLSPQCDGRVLCHGAE